MELPVKYIKSDLDCLHDQECIDNKRLRKSTSVIRVSLFAAQSGFTSLFIAIIIILLRRTERNEIPNAEGVKRVFSAPTRPTLLRDSCAIMLGFVLFYSLLCELYFSLNLPGVLHIKKQ